MTKEDLSPYIEFEAENFWLQSVNPINNDSTLLQHGFEDVESAYNEFRRDDSALFIINTFFKMNYLLKDEYLIAFMYNMVLTNRRLFMWFSDLKKSIPLQNLKLYEQVKWGSGIKAEYLYNGATQTFRLENKWMLPDRVNNALNQHQNEKVTEEELIIASNLKPTLDALYGSFNEITNNDLSTNEINVNPINQEIKEVKTQYINPIPIKKPKANYKGLIILCIIFLFLGGCIYIIEKSDDSANTSSTVNSSANTNTSPSPANNVVVNVDDINAVNSFLTSKTFVSDDVSVRFSPGGYYEVSKNYQVAFSGKWTIGERKYDSSIMIDLESEAGNTEMMLSTDGKIMDKGTLKVFQ